MANNKSQLEVVFYWEYVVTVHDSINKDIDNVYFLIHVLSSMNILSLRKLYPPCTGSTNKVHITHYLCSALILSLPRDNTILRKR